VFPLGRVRTPLIRRPNIVARVVRLRSSIPTDSVERILSNELCRATPFDVLVRSVRLRRIAHLRAKLQCLAHACLWRAVGLRRGSPLCLARATLGEILLKGVRCMLKIQSYFLLCIGLIGLILSTGGSFVYGQDISRDSSAQFFWVNGGLGASSFGVSPGVSVSYQSRKSLVSVRYVYNEEFQILGPSPSETVWDVGVLYGRSAKVSYGLASISGGIGVVGGVRRGKYLGSSGWFSSNYEKLTFLTVGIPVESQLFWTPLSFFGIGIYGFANLNTEKSFIGGLFCIQIGKLR